MAVDFDTFYQWCVDRFGEDNIKGVKHTSHGDEIMANSFYTLKKLGEEDHGYNLWMNPSGGKGKKEPEKGSFRCWKTDTMGTLVSLVADYDGIDYYEAEEMLCGASSLRALEKKVHEFFGHKEEAWDTSNVPEPKKLVELPPHTHMIRDLPDEHFMKHRATNYLTARKIPWQDFYVCLRGDYRDRIIIPYYDREGQLIWFNGRLMEDKQGAIKYMKCKSDGLAITQDDILYMTDWPKPGAKMYITEGEFDALSLRMAGFSACAIGGKFMSDIQIELIRPYIPVLAFDSDKGDFYADSGLQALINVGKQLLEKGFPRIGYVRPPKAFKDWNKLLVDRDAKTVREYAERYEKLFTPTTPTLLMSKRL